MGDYMLREMDSAGNTLASAYAGGRFSLLQAQADASGNWYLLGTFYDSVVLSSSMKLGRDSFGNGASYFLCRLHAGTLAPDWLTTLGGNSNCSIAAISVSGNSIYVPVDSLVSTKFLKYSTATGIPTTLWTQIGRSYTSYLEADSQGNIYVTGNCLLNGGLDFNGTMPPAPSSLKYPWYIARYHANGQLHWTYFLTDITCTSHGFKLAGNNAVYLGGMLADSTSLGGYHFNKPNSMFNSDFVLARLDSNGSLVWAQQRPAGTTGFGSIFFSTQFHTAVLDTMLYMYCETSGTFPFGTGVSITTTANRHLATLVAFNAATGNPQWAKNVAGLYTLSQHIISDGYSLWMTGNGSDSNALKFDTASVPTTVGQYIPYLAKMKVRNKPGGVVGPTGITMQSSEHGTTIYPNPAQGYATVDNLRDGERVSVRDAMGRLVGCTTEAARRQIRLVTATLPRGVYFVEINGQAGRQVFRLLLL